MYGPYKVDIFNNVMTDLTVYIYNNTLDSLPTCISINKRSAASRDLRQWTSFATDVSHDQHHVTQAGEGLVKAPGRHLGSGCPMSVACTSFLSLI